MHPALPKQFCITNILLPSSYELIYYRLQVFLTKYIDQQLLSAFLDWSWVLKGNIVLVKLVTFMVQLFSERTWKGSPRLEWINRVVLGFYNQCDEPTVNALRHPRWDTSHYCGNSLLILQCSYCQSRIWQAILDDIGPLNSSHIFHIWCLEGCRLEWLANDVQVSNFVGAQFYWIHNNTGCRFLGASFSVLVLSIHAVYHLYVKVASCDDSLCM